MPYYMGMALVAFTLSLLSAKPASAAWECVGSEVACSSRGLTARHAGKPRHIAKALAAKERRIASGHGRKHLAHYKGTARRSHDVAYSGSGGSVGLASYYYQGTRTASGARFNPSGMTAAHRSLPFGTRVLVTHLASGRSVTVTINDRGPFVRGRIIDLSRGAASALGITGAGVARVQVAVLGRG